MAAEEPLALKRSRRDGRAVSYKESDEEDIFRDAGDSTSGPRRSGRVTTKELPLDALVGTEMPVVGAPDFRYSVGGVETGGAEADRILREVESDDSIISLKAQFAGCRRVALLLRTRVVAAAVIELHSAGVLEIPILASSRSARQQGFGSLLLALLQELAVGRLKAAYLVVSATDESRRFWLRQGLHAPAHCAPSVAAAMRELAQRGSCFGFFQTTQMACQLPAEGATPGALVSKAAERMRVRSSTPKGVASARAAEALGYDELPPGGSFVLTADGQRVPAYPPEEGRSIVVPAHRLLACSRDGPGAAVAAAGGSPSALPKWGSAGWGVCCTLPIRPGQVVLEVCGRWLTDEEHAALEDKSWCVGLDERSRAAKREAGDVLLWLDLRQAASMARLVGECTEAPNLELVMWPEGEAPRRLYLVARHDIPAYAELAWERPASARRRAAADAAAPEGLVGGAAGGPANRAALKAIAQPRAPLSVGSQAEVRQEEAGIQGARYAATVLAGGRADGLVRVRYEALFESELSAQPLDEWVQPADQDAVRPLPPASPDGFHGGLQAGDELEFRYEEGWWPVVLQRVAGRTFDIEPRDGERFKALTTATNATRLRPAWRWDGADEGGVWSFSTRAAGRALFDASGQPQNPAPPAAAARSNHANASVGASGSGPRPEVAATREATKRYAACAEPQPRQQPIVLPRQQTENASLRVLQGLTQMHGQRHDALLLEPPAQAAQPQVTGPAQCQQPEGFQQAQQLQHLNQLRDLQQLHLLQHLHQQKQQSQLQSQSYLPSQSHLQPPTLPHSFQSAQVEQQPHRQEEVQHALLQQQFQLRNYTSGSTR